VLNGINSLCVFLLALLLLLGFDVALVFGEGLADLAGALAAHIQRLVLGALIKFLKVLFGVLSDDCVDGSDALPHNTHFGHLGRCGINGLCDHKGSIFLLKTIQLLQELLAGLAANVAASHSSRTGRHLEKNLQNPSRSTKFLY